MNTHTNIKTLSVRVKDRHSKYLRALAFDVNQVWNAANEVTDMCCAIPVPGVGMVYQNITAFDLQKQLKGIRKERGLRIGSSTFQEVIAAHGKARKQFKRNKLRWRSSSGSKRALGWVPFKVGNAKWVNGTVKFGGVHFKVWDSYGLSKYKFRAGSFSEDARGRWYFNVAVEVEVTDTAGAGQVGVDLGLKTTATCSDGTVLERGAHYRRAERKLAIAQRANKKRRVQALHAKIKNQRADQNHKFTTALVKNNSLIVVGDVSSKVLASTNMAKSVLDAGWYQLKTQLAYKAKAHQAVYLEVNEAYSTQTCSSCGSMPDSRPRGIAGLGIREWSCSGCGAMHDRDINGAKNMINE